MCHSNRTLMREFKTPNFAVRAYISPDDELDLSFDDTGEVRDKLDDGVYTAFQTEIEVLFRGAVVGTYYLGGSIYGDPREFFVEHVGLAAKSRADGVTYGCYFPDMIRQAIREARNTLGNAPTMRGV